VSCEDFKGSAHAFREFMRREQDAIERGERVGVSVKWRRAVQRERPPPATTGDITDAEEASRYRRGP